MGKRNPGALKKYKVNVSVIGSASRTVLAASKEEAERTVEKMLLQPDRQTRNGPHGPSSGGGAPGLMSSLQ